MEEKEKLEEKIKSYKSKEIELIKTIPGMGEISSRTILAAIGRDKEIQEGEGIDELLRVSAECEGKWRASGVWTYHARRPQRSETSRNSKCTCGVKKQDG